MCGLVGWVLSSRLEDRGFKCLQHTYMVSNGNGIEWKWYQMEIVSNGRGIKCKWY